MHNLESTDYKQELEVKLKQWQLEETATLDMLAVYDYSIYMNKANQYGSFFDEFVFDTLMEKMVTSLETSKANITIKSKDTSSLLQELHKKFHTTCAEYKQYEECKQTLKDIQTDYRESTVIKSIIGSYETKKFDFIDMLLENSDYKWIRRLLVADINKELKCKIIDNLCFCYMSRIRYQNISSFFTTPDQFFSGIPVEFAKQQLKDAINDYCNGNKNKEHILDKLLSNKQYDVIRELHKIGLFDLNFISISEYESMYNNSVPISLSAHICAVNASNDDFMELYQSQTYLNQSHDVLQNNEKYIYHFIPVTQMPSFIEISHLPLTKNHIELIGKRVLYYQINEKESSPLLIVKIKKAIESKGKSEKGMKKVREYSQMFEAIANYDDYLRRKKEEAENKNSKLEKRKKELLDARYNLYIRLYHMNDSLQEQMPGKTKIKNIHFVQNEKK